MSEFVFLKSFSQGHICERNFQKAKKTKKIGGLSRRCVVGWWQWILSLAKTYESAMLRSCAFCSNLLRQGN
jgi:hypothetical protein